MTFKDTGRSMWVLIAIGLACVAAAVLLVSNGASHNFALTYPACLHERVEVCPHTALAAHCNHVAIVCDRWSPHLMPWVGDWLTETIAVISISALLMLYAARLKS